MNQEEEQEYKLKLAKLEKQVHLLKGHLNNLEVAFAEISTPMGIIKYSNNNSPSFELIFANPAFFTLSGIETFSLPLYLKDAFVFLPEFNVLSVKEFVINRKLDKIVFTYLYKQRNLKLSFHKTGPNQLSFNFEDVTDFKAQRDELVKTSRQLKESQTIAKIGNWVHSHIDNKHYWSSEILRILEIDQQEEVSFNTLLSFVHPDDMDEVKQVYQESISKKSGYEITHRIVAQSGSIKTVNQKSYTEYNEYGEPIQTIGIVQDITSLEFARSLVQKSEEKFRSVFQNSPIAIILVDKDLSPLTINPQFQHMVGYNFSEISKMHLSDFTHPSDYNPNEDQYARLFNNEIGSFTVIKRYIRKDLEMIWVKLTVSAVKSTEGSVDLAVAMVQDITAEKQASEELIRSEHKYRTLIENASDGIGLFNMEGKPVIFNAALHNLLGYTADEYFSYDHASMELIHEEDKKAFFEGFPKLLENKKIQLEKRIRNKEGDYVYCSFSFNPVLHDNEPAYLLFMRDISARKFAEQQNEEYRMFLETIMDNIPVSLFAKTTPDFRYLYWNHTLEKLTGILAEDAIGSTDMELMSIKSEADEYFAEDHEVYKYNKRIDKEHVLTNSLGNRNTLHTIKVLHKSTIGNPLILGISVDITKMKDIEQQIATSTQLLKEAQKIARLGYWEYIVDKNLIFDNIENRQTFNIHELPYFLNLQQFIELLNPADQYQAEETFNISLKEAKESEVIVRVQVEGKMRHVALKLVPVCNEHGTVTKLRGTSLDITRVRTSEIALRESETRLKQAEHIAKVGYWNYDFDGKKLETSDEIWNILETPQLKAEIILKDYVEFVHPADRENILALYLKSKESTLPFSHDFRIVLKTGKTKFLKAKGTFVRNQKGEIVRSIGTIQDISELKEKETVLDKYSRQLKEIQELTRTGYFEMNLSTGKNIFSDTMSEVLGKGKSANELSIGAFNSAIAAEDKKSILSNLESFIASKEDYILNYRLGVHGKEKFINEIGRFSTDADSGETTLTRIIQDISHIREREISLVNAQSKLSQIEKYDFIGSWEYNTSKHTYHLSEKLRKFLGIDKLKHQLKDFVGLIHPDDKFSVQKVLTNSFAQKEDFALTFRMMVPGNDKEVKYVNTIGSVIKNTLNEWVVYGLLRDVSQYRETLKKQQETQQLFSAINDSNLIASLIFQDGKHIFVNKKWSKLTGISEEKALSGLPLHDIYKSETVDEINFQIREWKNNMPEELEHTMVFKPLRAQAFTALIFAKDVYMNKRQALLVLIRPE
jgi:PAS domain S-box-containing protein